MTRTNATPADLEHLRSTFRKAERVARSGGPPFAARLVGADGAGRLDAKNETARDGDPTSHAEIVLVRDATRRFARAELGAMTMFTSAEPCTMCAGAIILSGIGRVVYGVSAEALAVRLPPPPGVVVPGISGRETFDATPDGPVVIGPLLEDEALAHMIVP